MQKKNKATAGAVVKKQPGDQGLAVISQEEFSVERMILQAIQSGVPVETMERILAMRSQLKAEKAKEAFDRAMSNFQKDCPVIKKTKSVKTNDGKVAYTYAPIDEIVRQTKKLLAENGLSYSIKTETTPAGVKSICIIRHIGGHSEQSEMEVPLGNKTSVMSNSQVTAAAMTFAKRYAFTNALGIMTSDDDREEILKTDEAEPDEISKAKAVLDKCMTHDDVKKIWNIWEKKFGKKITGNVELINYANEIISNIKHAKQNENIQKAKTA